MQRTLFFASALLSAFAVNASPVHVLVVRDAVYLPGFESKGCYTEATGIRALSGRAFVDDEMTLEKCAASCTGFQFFGAEYGRECFCGNYFNTGSVPAADHECDFNCPGNADEKCGGGNRLTVYESVEDKYDFTSFSALGCHTEATNGRALALKRTREEDMTIQKCADICGASKYGLFGLEYYVECYCGNALELGSVPTAETGCNLPCGGDHAETCGGENKLNLYAFPALAAPSPTSSSAPLPTDPVTYSNEGCYTEATTGRALTGKVSYDDTMTVAKCAAACSSYTYFGVEYAVECFCGNTLSEGSVPTLASECNFKCPGKNSETCGAGNRLNVYKNAPQTSSSAAPFSTTLSSSYTSSYESSSVSSTASEVSSSATTSAELSSSTTEIPGSSSATTTESSSTTPAPPSSTTTTTIESSSITPAPSSSTTTTTTESSSTTTTTPPVSTATGLWSIANGPRTGQVLWLANGYLQPYTAQAGVVISFDAAGGQPFLSNAPTYKLVLRQASTIVGVLGIVAPSQVAANDPSVTCTLGQAGNFSCLASNGFNTIYSCGGYLYMARVGWPQSGCVVVTLKTTA